MTGSLYKRGSVWWYSLYVNGIGPKGFGLYRCKDTKGADQYDEVQLLKQFAGGGEHGQARRVGGEQAVSFSRKGPKQQEKAKGKK